MAETDRRAAVDCMSEPRSRDGALFLEAPFTLYQRLRLETAECPPLTIGRQVITAQRCMYLNFGRAPFVGFPAATTPSAADARSRPLDELRTALGPGKLCRKSFPTKLSRDKGKSREDGRPLACDDGMQMSGPLDLVTDQIRLSQRDIVSID